MRHKGKPSLSEAKASFSASMDEVHPLKSALQNKGKPSLSEAKASFSASMDEVHPLKSALQIHPLLTLGTIAAVGALVGFAGTKTLKKTGSLAAKTLSAQALPLAIIKKFFL